jgi:nucleoside-diphosphate-sugar epimerase
MKKILITGAYGFVGTNLSRYLAKDHEVLALDLARSEGPGYAAFYSWDELDVIPWDAIDTVIHLAGKAHDTKNTAEEKAYFDANLGTTQKVFDRFLAAKTGKFIFFSTVKAAADSAGAGALTEDAVPDPRGPYGVSKLAAEQYIRERCRELGEGDFLGGRSGKSVYILRPCMICGPGNKGNLNLLYKMVSKGVPYPLGAFENRRSFTSMDNLCFVIGSLIKKDIAAGIYHVGDDEAVSTRELISLIAKAAGKRERIWNWDKNLVTALAKAGDLLRLPFNSERLRKLTENYVVSNLKLKKALGVDRMPVSSKDGLEKAVLSLKEGSK